MNQTTVTMVDYHVVLVLMNLNSLLTLLQQSVHLLLFFCNCKKRRRAQCQIIVPGLACVLVFSVLHSNVNTYFLFHCLTNYIFLIFVSRCSWMPLPEFSLNKILPSVIQQHKWKTFVISGETLTCKMAYYYTVIIFCDKCFHVKYNN